ncbi:OLC1v1001413C1 [Oldenlandia corymbosa var. corymbosa]|uniref:OLC1v1001413C1 n=1 Tax=Oldenlandia corymbosa var. corymbosa TaxID=529605 RepID=A0AAV1D554_OLDCO|nr:OLC1v1001413C1 [Oldenlandia corymbosa var. corymbosa]
MPYSPAILADIDPSCSAGSAIWMSQTWLLYFGIREPHIPGRVLRQFGFLQRVPDNTFIMEKKEIEKLHKETHGKKCRDDVLQRWENRHNTLAGLQTDMTLEPQAAPEYLVWYQNHTVTLVTNPSDYRQPQGFQGSAESLHIMANLVQNMRHITLDGLQRNPVNSWNHNAFLQLHDLTQQAMTVSKTSVWADSENPSQDFVPADPTQEYIPPRPPRTDRGGFQLGSGRMRKPVATQNTGGQSSTPHVSPYRPASPHHHPSPPFEQMHFDSDFINLDPNAGGFFETSYEGGHHSQHLGGDDIHHDQEDDQDHEDIGDQEHDDDADDAEHSSHDHYEGADQGQGPSDGTMPFTPIALGKGQRNIKKKKKCCMTDSQEKKRKM